MRSITTKNDTKWNMTNFGDDQKWRVLPSTNKCLILPFLCVHQYKPHLPFPVSFFVMNPHSTNFVSFTFYYKTSKVCKSKTYIPLTFFHHFLLHFLKFISDQMWPYNGKQRKYYFKIQHMLDQTSSSVHGDPY